jgi:hypothetical protein
MSKKRLLVIGLLVSWGIVKANTPGGCETCCVLDGTCFDKPELSLLAPVNPEIGAFTLTEADFPQNLMLDVDVDAGGAGQGGRHR